MGDRGHRHVYAGALFQSLAERRPDIDSGVFAYAKAGFGDYVGFLSAFGYWLGSVLGNTGKRVRRKIRRVRELRNGR